ncbi:MAG: TonB family protein [Terriglobales bacterium]
MEARGPAKKKGCSAIEFSVSSHGDVGGRKVIASSGDEQLDRASWLAISNSAPFAPLPSGYLQPEIVLRFHFFYNPDWRVYKHALSESIRARTSVTASVISSTGRAGSPQTLYAPLPSYTERAIQGQRRGTVLISLLVNKAGGVSHVHVVEGIDHDLDREARKTIQTWKFQPRTISGEGTEVPLNVKVTFNLK